MEEVGAGVSISPVAFLVVQGGTVKLLPVNHSSAIDKLLDYVPDLMEKVNSMLNKKIENKKEERETQEDTSIHIPNMNKIYPKKNKKLKMISKKKLKQRKEFREYISIADEKVLDIKKAGIKLVADDEIFIMVNGTNNYWISNHGRMVNNLHGKFHMHKSGYVHYTLFGMESKIDTYTDKLVAEHFLENTNPKEYNRIWHLDRNKENCFYKNLVWVDCKEYYHLKRGDSRIEDLGRQQEYVPYITLKSNTAYSIWNGIYIRCYKDNRVYDGSYMCDLWKNDKDSFVEWWHSEYYECEGESMAVDKDLLYPGNKEYAPDKCCIIPQTLIQCCQIARNIRLNGSHR